MKTIDKSKLMKRAWYLVKNQGYSLGVAMSKVWSEMKSFIAEKIKEEKAKIENAKLQEWWSTDEYKTKSKELLQIGLSNNYFNF